VADARFPTVADDGEDVRPAVIAEAAAALSLVAPIPAAQIPAAGSNYSHQLRPASQVRLVVVHVTEGSYGGTISWFRNRKARAAANYVVGRDGQVAHMVPDDRVAWHAGNSYVNYHSIGIENEGYTGIDGTFTDAEYRASAQLAAGLLRRYRLPADRAHLIGHNQVPDPHHRGEYGGFAHHSDPGAYWDWTRYVGYVRDYLAGRTPPPRALDVVIDGLGLGEHVTGVVPWTVEPTGAVRVDFLVDGVVEASASEPPFSYDWDTSLETIGRHVLTARAVAADGRSAIATTVVDSQTPPAPPPVVTLPGLPPTLTGVVTLQPELSGGPVARVELWIDGTVVQTAAASPWTLAWDATTVPPGQHTLAVRAVGPRGRAAAAVVVVTTGP
jgi:N-acetylmuramoyl-L-alanine amidase-like protein/Big-like domain-containing protein